MAKRSRNAVKGLSALVWCALSDFAAGFTPDDGCTRATFLQAAGENEIAGALWLVDEGGLSQQLSQAVWAGFRRPRGNLVAQSLAAHGNNPLAATLRGRRVSRIAVHPARQREGTGRQLIAGALQYTQDLDYLSVSLVTPGSYGVSGNAAVLCWCGWVIIGKPAAVAIRRWRCYR